MSNHLLQVASIYHHTQDTPASSWTINHNLNTYPIVDVYITDGGQIQKILPKDVIYVDPMNCTISFSIPRSGTATVV